MLKTNENISGHIFIIPNGSFTIRNSTVLFEDCRSDLNRVYNTNFDALKGTKFEDIRWIQVWMCTPGNTNSNWHDHAIDGYRCLDGRKNKQDNSVTLWHPISQYMPKELFLGHKEGDIITLYLPVERSVALDDGSVVCESATLKVSLQLKQTGYRYERFGKFEEVLARV